MPASFTLTVAASGRGVSSPSRASDPISLILVSSVTLTGFAMSRLAPCTVRDSGASSTLAAGRIVRSSAEMLASRNANSCRSIFQGVPVAAAEGEW